MLITRIKELDRLSRYDKIIETLAMPARVPGAAPELRYCLAHALHEQDRIAEAIRELLALLQALLKTENPETKHSIPHLAKSVACHLAEWCVFYHPVVHAKSESEGHFLGQSLSLALSTMRMLERLPGNEDLKRKATEYENNLLRIAGKPNGIFIRQNSPPSLQIEPTNCCNLQCTMCPRRLMKRPLGFLESDALDQALASWAGRSQRLLVKHALFGTETSRERNGAVKLFFMGEPLLHPRLDALIRQVKEAGASCGIQTNGLLLNRPEIRAKLIAAAPDAISISIDGHSAETYALLRKGASWDACRGAILALARERDQAGLAKTTRLALASILSDNTPSAREQLKAFLAPLLGIADNVAILGLNRLQNPKFINGEDMLVEYKRPAATLTHKAGCAESFSKLNMLWDGRLLPCCPDHDAAMPMGHAADGICRVWNGEKMRDLHQSLATGRLDRYPYCRKCLGIRPCTGPEVTSQ